MNLRYKYRFYPTEEQQDTLVDIFGCSRFVYNWALALRSQAWTEDKTKINYTETSKRLTQLKKQEGFSWLNNVPSVPLQQSLRHLQVAFNNFFDKSRPDAKYPAFKSKSSRQSATFVDTAFRFKNGVVNATSLGDLNIRFHRELPSVPKTMTIIKDCDDRYYVSFTVESEHKKLDKTNNKVGIDLGVKTFAVCSNGDEYRGVNEILKPMYQELKTKQKHLSRKKKGSRRRAKAKLKVARQHSKISRVRKDYLDKLSKKIIDNNDLIVIEDLGVKPMTKNQGQKRKSINQSMITQGWNMFSQMLCYKAELYGREVKKIDRYFPSSKMCSHCGHINNELMVQDREWDCLKCQARHNRDLNAAKNILTAGTVVYTRLEDMVVIQP